MYTLITEENRCGGQVGAKPNHNNWTEIHYEGGLIKEFWDGLQWIESATNQEIDTHNTPIYEQKIIDLFTYLLLRALSSSMGKYGSFEYLQIQRNEYLKKYEVAKGISNNVSIANAIVKEMERDFPTPKLDAILTAYGYNDLSGTQLEKMYTLIIIRFEYANSKLEAFEGMAIDFRTKCRTLVELCQWDKLDTAFSLIDNLPTELSNADIENYYLQFENL